ncbi:SAM-dependent methyltransferase [Candidatus Entotheonella palauensis]|uniref:DUF7884 domain-containing protein n=1 Tax=Candidatus Entotheonella gemina TaxID=1429439 RepID=W4M9D1_9BACT|nr:cyclopropane-fatty-acyl-phospholipid synthase family protein [Candidatus Entotheonella palauensis]ETX06793.1 MAG: hypothetical protein ETSY2_14985 [Candidatus Entotheonella gemina]
MSMKQIFIENLEKLGKLEFAVRMIFPDGSEFVCGDSEPDCTIHFKTEAALTKSLTSSSLGFGEAFMAQEIDVTGNIPRVGELGALLMKAPPTLSVRAKLKLLMGSLSRGNTIQLAGKNTAHHYDVGNDFYSLWLDEQLQYSCAYFTTPDDSLEVAQRAKMDRVCRKLRLRPGITLVDCGSGWGGLPLHAAMNYGVRVRGFTNSKEQFTFSTEKARRLGVGKEQVEFVLDDYRNIADDGVRYDRFVSIGMLEHVGRANWDTFFAVVRKAVKPGGISLVHSIGRSAPRAQDPFAQKHLFPGYCFPTLTDMVRPLEQINDDVHVVDVENLRPHYALTLERWYERFSLHRDVIKEKYGESLTRKYEIYLACGPSWFNHDGVMLFQVLISHGMNKSAPLTRDHMSEERPASSTPEPFAKAERDGHSVTSSTAQ